MKWIEIKSEKDLPEEGKYVWARHNRGTWNDSTDQENVNCVVIKLVRGISKADRESMKENNTDYLYMQPEDHGSHKISGLRSDMYIFGDEEGNNMVPWAWFSFGSDSFFGQEITHWTSIEPLK